MALYMQEKARSGSRQAPVTEAEQAAPVQLAACYRMFDHLGWTEMIFNHITLRVPGPDRIFLNHAFEGVTADLGEQQRLLASIGGKKAVILRNDGLLAWGGDIAEAFMWRWTLQRACDVQIAAAAAGTMNRLAPQVLEQAVREAGRAEPAVCEAVYAASVRQVDAKDSSYKN